MPRCTTISISLNGDKMYQLEKLNEYIKNNDSVAIKYLMANSGLILKDGKFFIKDKTEGKKQESFWNQRQQARKILLNSLYGAILNAACRFNDQRIGQSVTLSGRSIVRHMNSKINEVITGEYSIDGDGIIYIDKIVSQI